MFDVLTGKPKTEEMAREEKTAKSAKNTLEVSVFSLNSSIDERILFPLSKVEMHITAPIRMIKISGGFVFPLAPTPKTTNKIAKSFCPSCEPCINDSTEQLRVSKMRLIFRCGEIFLTKKRDKR